MQPEQLRVFVPVDFGHATASSVAPICPHIGAPSVLASHSSPFSARPPVGLPTMKLCMFRPVDTPMERGWVGRLDGAEVVHLAAQTLQHFFIGGGSAREHARYPLSDIELLLPLPWPPSVRVFDEDGSFEFANPAAVVGPSAVLTPPPGAAVVADVGLAGLVGSDEVVAVSPAARLRAPALPAPEGPGLRDRARSVVHDTRRGACRDRPDGDRGREAARGRARLVRLGNGPRLRGREHAAARRRPAARTRRGRRGRSGGIVRDDRKRRPRASVVCDRREERTP